MDSASPEHGQQEPPAALTLHEAAGLYDVTVKTLSLHLRCGRLSGYKARGAAGREWRVTADAMDQAGYRRRSESVGVIDGQAVSGRDGQELVRLRQQLAVAKRAALAERRRADDLDRRLGHAQLECGRLRSALAAATGDDAASEPQLDADSARWLIAAVTGGSTSQSATHFSAEASTLV